MTSRIGSALDGEPDGVETDELGRGVVGRAGMVLPRAGPGPAVLACNPRVGRSP